jgi:hypothetical protein
VEPWSARGQAAVSTGWQFGASVHRLEPPRLDTSASTSGVSRRFSTNEITNEMESTAATGEKDETSETQTRSSRALLRRGETHETTPMKLPRWGSRVRIPSSAPEKSQVRAGASRPFVMYGIV